MKLVLGPASVSRQQLLEKWGYSFEIVKPGIDEKQIRDDDPRQVTLKLARAKAKAITSKLSEPAVIITSDQVVEFRGKVMEKPETEAEARFYLEHAHLPASTITAVVVTNTATGKQAEGVDVMTVEMNPFPAALIDAYIKKGECYNMAGGFDIADPMIALYVKTITGETESGLGLPKKLTLQLLKEVGYRR